MTAMELYQSHKEGKLTWLRGRRVIGYKLFNYGGFVILTKDEDGLCEWWEPDERVPGSDLTPKEKE